MLKFIASSNENIISSVGGFTDVVRNASLYPCDTNGIKGRKLIIAPNLNSNSFLRSESIV